MEIYVHTALVTICYRRVSCIVYVSNVSSASAASNHLQVERNSHKKVFFVAIVTCKKYKAQETTS